MNENAILISTLFIRLNGLIAFVFSYIAAMERTRTRVWHSESKENLKMQLDICKTKLFFFLPESFLNSATPL